MPVTVQLQAKNIPVEGSTIFVTMRDALPGFHHWRLKYVGAHGRGLGMVQILPKTFVELGGNQLQGKRFESATNTVVNDASLNYFVQWENQSTQGSYAAATNIISTATNIHLGRVRQTSRKLEFVIRGFDITNFLNPNIIDSVVIILEAD